MNKVYVILQQLLIHGLFNNVVCISMPRHVKKGWAVNFKQAFTVWIEEPGISMEEMKKATKYVPHLVFETQIYTVDISNTKKGC